MKKQILSMMFLILTMSFAGVNVIAQESAVHKTTARPFTKPTGPLQPVAGVPYDYSATVNPAGGTATWFVTTSPKFIEGNTLNTEFFKIKGNDYILDETNLGVNENSASETNVSITWNTIGLSKVDYTSETKTPLFVGIMYEAPADNCDNNNIQVWKLDPVNAFTLDITNVDASFNSKGYGEDVLQCFDQVVNATYNFENNSVEMDYGTQTLYYEVIAANFSSRFNAQFQLDELEPGQVATLYWGYSPETANTKINFADGKYESIEAFTNVANTSNGVSIYAKVVIENKSFEGLAPQTITLRVDGTDAAGNDDVKPDGDPETVFSDFASQTITPRPTINNPVPSPFVTKD